VARMLKQTSYGFSNITNFNFPHNLTYTSLVFLRLFNFALALGLDSSLLSGNSSPPDFCSCRIHQAVSPNKLGNYAFKHPLFSL